MQASHSGSQAEDIDAIKGVKPNDIIVAFMGQTGSGKSRFIDLLTGQEGRRAQNNLGSVTQGIQATRIAVTTKLSDDIGLTLPSDLNGRDIVFVDTPGFDDSQKTDYQVLCLINDWLKETYQREVKLSGLVYLHPITHNRMAGTPHKNLRMFAKLCGDIAMTQVILVTTFWERGDARRAGESRVKELREIYWKPLLEKGSSVDALKTTTSTEAWRVISALLSKRVKESERVLLQEEVVDQKIAFNETEAAQTLYTELQKQLAMKKKTLTRLHQQVKESTDAQIRGQLEREIQQTQREFDQTFVESKALKRSLFTRLRTFVSGKKTQAKGVKVPEPVQEQK
ncbi:hypothetical protein NP233_g3415 [Leucocoprinus birnbaumii]|uniref:G domain-containing protein n=1 Tax=Leucocoprinus birnbaumii TaxID=56174 RepID=A0AAD5YYC1_9AGAR|nr:hypothetical protein NP233_g3415 [Leucocoprinus birnbaumii]